MWPLLVYVLLGIATLVLFSRRRKRLSSLVQYPLPPGPPTLPLIGHLHVMPTSHEWVTYGEWRKTYGDVMHLQVLGRSLIILGSLDAAKALLERQSSVSSDRPHFIMISDLMGWDWAVQFMGIGPRFRKYRKTVQQCLQPSNTEKYLPLVEKESRRLLQSLLNDPSDFQAHIKHHSGGLMMTILYGEDEGSIRDQYVVKADGAIDGLVEAGNVGKFLVDFIPALRYIPEWMPGAQFQQQARIWKQMAREMIEIPFQNTKSSYDLGLAAPSITKSLLEQQTSEKDGVIDPELIMGAVGVLYVGGADTSLSALETFILAMVLHPEVQKKAHAEIDRVVGADRLPVVSDRPDLPYFEAILSEVLRWNPGVPLGVPHSMTEGCELNGYYIPAGATVLVNQWAILHDEKNYLEPFQFKPERFISSSGAPSLLDPREASFGFGRRVCPGRHFADSLLWLIMIHIISVFDLGKPLDDNGNVVELTGKYASGLVTRPEPFACRITPRSPALAALVQDGF